MQVLIFSDEHGYILEPYGDEDSQSYWVSAPATERLWRAGWRPYIMQRVSRHLFDYLWFAGQIRRWEHHPGCTFCKAPLDNAQ